MENTSKNPRKSQFFNYIFFFLLGALPSFKFCDYMQGKREQEMVKGMVKYFDQSMTAYVKLHTSYNEHLNAEVSELKGDDKEYDNFIKSSDLHQTEADSLIRDAADKFGIFIK